MRFIIYFIVIISFFSTKSYTQDKGIKYLPDPIYSPVYKNAKHPLADILLMSDDGDARAQYILADLYLKGKGGFAKNTEQSKHFFEESAKQKYLHSFIRLAAIAKSEEDFPAAYKWYLIGLKYSKRENSELYNFMNKQKNKLIDNNLINKEDVKLSKKQAKIWRKSLKSDSVVINIAPKYNQ